MSDLTSQSWVGSSQRTLPPTFSQVAEAKRKQDELREYDNVLATAVQSEWVTSAASRMYERETAEFAPVGGYQVSKEEQHELQQQFGYQMAQEVMQGVKSPEELAFRRKNAEADKERGEVLARNGFTGFAAQMGAALFDPVGWAASLVAAPVAGSFKVGRLGRIGIGALTGAAENAAIEAVLAQGDYTRDVDDVLLAAGFGGMMGGTIGAMSRAKATPPVGTGQPMDEGLDAVLRGADDFDRASAKLVRDAMEYDAYMAARNFEPTLAPEIDIDMSILRHAEDLQKAASVRMTAKEKGNLKAKIREEQEALQALEEGRVAARAEKAAAKGAPRSKAEALDTKVELAAIGRRFDQPIKDAQKRIQELTDRLQAVEGAGAAKAEVKRFINLPREQQIKELGLDIPARKFDVTKAVDAAVAEIRAARKKTPTEERAAQIEEETITHRVILLGEDRKSVV